MDVESFAEGILGSIVVNEGERANVGASIAFIAESEADLAEAKKKGGSAGGAAAVPAGACVLVGFRGSCAAPTAESGHSGLPLTCDTPWFRLSHRYHLPLQLPPPPLQPPQQPPLPHPHPQQPPPPRPPQRPQPPQHQRQLHPRQLHPVLTAA